MPDSRWRLDQFEEKLDVWISQFGISDDLSTIVLVWVLGLTDDPFTDVERVEGFEDFWFGAVPDTDDGAGRVVTCSFFADHETRTLRCDLFSTSTWPI